MGSTPTVPIAVAPAEHPWYADMCDAVKRGDGTVAELEEAVALIWLAKGEQELDAVLHPGLQWVQLRAAGVEMWLDKVHIDAERTFTSARGVYREAVAEHVVALMFAACKQLQVCARLRRWDAEAGSGGVLRGSTVGIIGAGGVGQELISYLEPFGVRALAVTRSGRDVEGSDASYDAAQLDEVWPQVDYLVLSAPSTDDTAALVGAKELAALPDHAWLINVARGSLVDTDALVTALRDGAIGGASLDVTEPEPLPDGHPLWTMDNVLITPHVANPKSNHRIKLVERVEENVRRFVAGEPLLGVVDPSAGY